MKSDDDDRDDTVPAVIELAPLERGRAVAATTPWQDVVAAFLNAAIDSRHTRLAYGADLREAFTWFGVHAVADVTGAQLMAYRGEVINNPNFALSTKSRKLWPLRSFLRWSRVLGAHRLSDDVIRIALRPPKGKARPRRPTLSDVQVGALLGAAECKRDRAMVVVFMGAGLRIAEVGALACTDLDVDPDGGLVIHVRQGKGSRDRDVPVNAEVRDAIDAYLIESGRTMRDPGPLFRTYDGLRDGKSYYSAAARRKQLSDRGATFRIVKKLMKRAGLDPRLSPHSLRHTFAMRALRAGASPVAIQKLLGHASLATTMIYLDHLELNELRAAIPSLPMARAASR